MAIRTTLNPASHGAQPASALAACRGAFVGVGLISIVCNVLALTGSLYMLEIYDRVIPSRSIPTLLGLSMLAGMLYAFQFLMDFIRTRILVRIGGALDRAICLPVFDALVQMPLRVRLVGDGKQPLRDLDQIRSFLSGTGPVALFDFPWIPFYLGICFLFHFWIGIAATVGGLVLIALTLLAELLARAPNHAATVHAANRFALAEESMSNAEALQAMGMRGRRAAAWDEINDRYVTQQREASDVAGGLGALSRAFRLALQSAIMGIGAYLVIEQQVTAGVIVAASILTARALAPIEIAISNWKGFLSARESWKRLSLLLASLPPQKETIALPPPCETLTVEDISVVPPGARLPSVQGMSFALKAGSALGIVGGNGCGKSSLMRTIVGAWSPVVGTVRLDRVDVRQWGDESLGRHIGYLPQYVELFAGTVSQNIARFEPNADPNKVFEAARIAGVHDMIAALPEAYNTDIGPGGSALSAGQRQRLALARALYGDPFLIALDEPMSNLDLEGVLALNQAIATLRQRGRIVIVIAHGPNALANVDLLLVMNRGRAVAFGPKEAVLSKAERTPAMPPLRIVPEKGVGHRE